jgi:zinc D-Ala-D-Ala carboxypeptidase
MLRYFLMEEFKCKGQNCCGGANLMNAEFLDELDELRHRYGKPLFISSAYRCPKHNARVSSTGTTGPHTTGRAVDFSIRGSEALALLKIALDMKFTGIGINQKGEGRFIHVDNLPNANGQPRPHIWGY